ncbi:MAG: replicative DNA helicase [Planctomycetota bacterium]
MSPPGLSDSHPEANPPFSEEAEVAVLGSIFVDNEAMGGVVQILESVGGRDAFYKRGHQEIFEAASELYDCNKAVDLITLREELKRRGRLEEAGGGDYLSYLMEMVPSAANVEHYAAIVRDKAVQRAVLRVGRMILDEAQRNQKSADELLDYAQREIMEVAQRRGSNDSVPVKSLLKAAFERIEKLQGQENRLTGLATGFADLDDITCGLQNSELIIIAGRPSMGKSTFAMNIAEHVAIQENIPVGFFSLEVSRQQFTQNLLCSHARVNAHKLRRGYLADSELQKLGIAAGRLEEANLFIDDTPGLSTMTLRAKARRLKLQHNIRMVVVDYLQLMDAPRAENRNQEISIISRSLKALARELDIPVVVLSQLSRAVEGRESHRPRMSDLRESGAIEQDADVILMLFREDYYNPEREQGKVEVIVAKQRNGPTGDISLALIKEHMRFQNLAAEGI